MLEKYWKIGHSYYGEFKSNLIGKALAGIQYALLPRCHKAGAQIDGRILIGSFKGADKVALEVFYDSKSVNGNIENKIDVLKELYESNSNEVFDSIAKNPRLRLKLLEDKCREYVWEAID